MLTLYPDQQDIINEIRAGFQQVRSILMVSPTGSGKTVMFSYLASAVAARGKRVYILVHRDELVDQVSGALTEFNVPHGFIAAGRPAGVQPVMVCSVFTLVNRMQNYPTPDMLIVDEAHHATTGTTWARIFEHYAAAYKLGVTATPIRLDGKPLKGSFDHMVEGLGTRELIDKGRLSDYILYLPPVVLSKMRMRMGDFNKEDMRHAMEKPQITGDAVDHYVRCAPGKRALAFCVSLDHASSVALEFERRGIKAARIDGAMDKTERRRLVREFSCGAIQVLTSCDLVSEGFDIPAIECTVLLRPTASLALYLQQIGRGLRRHPGKTHAIILDHCGNAGRHGYPDEAREWSLGEELTSERKRSTSDRGIRTCGGCFAAVKQGAMVCPYCGWEWPIEAREIEAVVGDLEAVTAEDRLAAVEIAKQARMQVGMAKTYVELLAIERERGYKPGWAHFTFKAKQARQRHG